MKNVYLLALTSILLFTGLPQVLASETKGITIVADGGGKELMENSLVAIALAVTQDADYIELPVNLTQDDQLIVFRDTTLSRLTNVTEIFPERDRTEGGYYVTDFSLAELRQLRLQKVFDDRATGLSMTIPSLQEALNLIKQLNQHYTKNCGVVINLIAPELYREEGKNVGSQLQNLLALTSYPPESKIFLQSTDPDELQTIAGWKTGDSGNKYSLIQAIELQPVADDDIFDGVTKKIKNSWLLTNSGRRILATYAAAVALPDELLQNSDPSITGFIQSLASFDIKVFSQAGGFQPKPSLAPDLSLPADQLAANETIKFDGRYVESVPRGVMNNPAPPGPSSSSSISEKANELPPFFSNLGLSGPKPVTHPQVSEPEDVDDDSNE